MSQASGWTPGPLILGTDAGSRKPARDAGLRAEQVALVELGRNGFRIGPPRPGADIVAIDPEGREIAIEVKNARQQGPQGRLFVTDTKAAADFHLFVDVNEERRDAKVWIVPSHFVREHGEVLTTEDVKPFEGAWDVLKKPV